MRIIHYNLGLPPSRSGGLTKYSIDLIEEQIKQGNQVSLLFPENKIDSRKKQSKSIISRGTWRGIKSYAILNAPPIPLLYGINDPKTIQNIHLTPNDIQSFNAFLDLEKPDIIHIHSLMGLPIEFLNCLKHKRIKTVYTSHDYYGICLKVNLINHRNLLCMQPSGENCLVCNALSPDSNFLRLRNSRIILKHKNLLNNLSNLKKKLFPANSITINAASETTIENINEFSSIINYYKSMFSYIDLFHFNSTVAKEVYEKFLNIDKSEVIPITHNDIRDKRKSKTISKTNIKIGFIGNKTSYKGLPLLVKTLNDLNTQHISNWELSVWGNTILPEYNNEKIFCRGRFDKTQIEYVYSQMDLLVVPSIWKETFSLVTLEALSHGVPVLVTTNVGAKDIVRIYNEEFIVEPTQTSLFNILMKILQNPELLIRYNSQIVNTNFDFSLHTHVQLLKSNIYLG